MVAAEVTAQALEMKVEAAGVAAQAQPVVVQASRSFASHNKPRKPKQGPTARIVLQLRLLSGYDQRHSLQVGQSRAYCWWCAGL
jgi:hypothetical protein